MGSHTIKSTDMTILRYPTVNRRVIDRLNAYYSVKSPSGNLINYILQTGIRQANLRRRQIRFFKCKQV